MGKRIAACSRRRPQTGHRTSCCDVETLAEGLFVIVGGSDVSADKETTLRAAMSAGAGGASDAEVAQRFGVTRQAVSYQKRKGRM